MGIIGSSPRYGWMVGGKADGRWYSSWGGYEVDWVGRFVAGGIDCGKERENETVLWIIRNFA